MADESIPGVDATGDKQARTWATILHLSMLSGTFIPFGGYVVPVVVWRLKRSEFPSLDPHGRHAVNWMISLVIYAVLSLPLCFIGIGIPLVWILGICAVAFPVVAAIKANDGIAWKYPLSIEFLK